MNTILELGLRIKQESWSQFNKLFRNLIVYGSIDLITVYLWLKFYLFYQIFMNINIVLDVYTFSRFRHVHCLLVYVLIFAQKWSILGILLIVSKQNDTWKTYLNENLEQYLFYFM